LKRLLFFAGQHPPPTLQSHLNQIVGCLGRKTNMYLSGLRHQILCIIPLILFSASLIAQDDGPPDWTMTKDQWGQVMFCQRIYKMSEVKPRLYGFDIEQCDKAEQLVMDVVTGFSKQDQVQMKAQAEQHAYRLSYNTSEPYLSVVGCREYCRQLAETKDSRNE